MRKKHPQSFYRDFLSLWVCFFLFVFSGTAQSPVFRNYTPKDGLPSNETYCVMQDSRGFIWIGTDGGVSRFDGYRFQNFTLAQGLADNTIFGMQEDRHGRIWFRSLSGKLSYWDNDSIYAIGANDTIAAIMEGAIMTSFYIDSGDTVWCGTRAGKGILKIQPGYKRSDIKLVGTGISGAYVCRIEPQSYIHGNVYTGEPPTSLIHFYLKERLGAKMKKGNVSVSYLLGMSLGGDSMLLSDGEALYVMRDNSLRTVGRMENYFGSRPTFLKKPGKEMWVGFFEKGVSQLHFKNGDLVCGNHALFEGSSVTDVIADREGGYWFTTLENGLFYAAPDHFTYVLALNSGSGSKNELGFAMLGADLVLSDVKDRVDIVRPDTVIRDVELVNLSLEKYSQGNAPFIINTGADYNKGNFTPYVAFPGDHFPVRLIDSLGQYPGVWRYAADTRSGKLFVASRYYLYLVEKGSQARFLAALPSRITSMYADDQGVLWLGGLNGLWSYAQNKFTYRGKVHPLLASRINDIEVGADGTWYMATHGNGLILKKNDQYKRLTTVEGLPSNNCECLLLDDHGTLWIGTKSGLCSINIKGDDLGTIKAYNLGSDALSQRVNHLAQSGNTLWIMTDRALLSHDLPMTDNTPVVPPVYITAFTANGILKKDSTEVLLPYDQSGIRISFIGLHYQRFGKIHYAYRLEGLDSAWHQTSNTEISFPFLPPGEYTFRVKALDGIAGSLEASVSFKVLAPWWRTWWFFLSAAAGAAALLALITASRIRAIRKREQEKTALHTQVANIEMKALRAQMNPHFIFNAINSIQNHIIKNDRKTAQDYLAKFARLIRNVLENSKSEQIPLIREIETLGLYIELEQLRVQGKFTYAINVDPSIPVYDALIPPLLLQPFVENSIQHGILPLEGRNGHIVIGVKREAGQLVCTIDDNGIGRAKAAERKKDRGSAYRSLGLSVTEERIDIINRFRKGVAGIVFEDKTDEDGNAAGTKVILTVPFITETLQR